VDWLGHGSSSRVGLRTCVPACGEDPRGAGRQPDRV
jgi:hypothetical protein